MIGLKFICVLRGIELKEIAKKLNVSKSTVTDWVSLRYSISEINLNKLSTLLQVRKELICKWLTYDDMIEIINLEKQKVS